MDPESEARLNYSAIARAKQPKGHRVTLLRIGAEHAQVFAGDGIEPETTLSLQIGARRIARDCLRHTPPTETDLEAAIAAIEDELATAWPLLQQPSILYTTNAAIGEIALLAGAGSGAEIVLARDAVEQTFEGLVSAALGSRPGLRQAFSDEGDFAATLIILREFLHHMQFESIIVRK